LFDFLKFFRFLKSTILIKIVMALTGLAIVGFLFGHAIGNLQFWLGPDAYNTYAAFLQAPLGIVEFLWILRIGLIVCLILHIISAVYLRIKNNAAKPIGYQVKNYAKAKLTSRTMLWTGLLVLSGLTFHLLHFTTGTLDFNNGYESYEAYPTGQFVMTASGCPTKNSCCKANADCCAEGQNFCKTECSDKQYKYVDTLTICCAEGQNFCKTECSDKQYKCVDTLTICCAEGQNFCKTECAEQKDCKSSCCSNKTPTINNYEKIHPGAVAELRHDVYAMVGKEFSCPWVALIYIIFVSLVGFHLNHAIQSGIHTLGIEGPKFTPVMRVLSTLLSIGLVLMFIILPLGVLVNSLGFCNCLVGGL